LTVEGFCVGDPFELVIGNKKVFCTQESENIFFPHIHQCIFETNICSGLNIDYSFLQCNMAKNSCRIHEFICSTFKGIFFDIRPKKALCKQDEGKDGEKC
jgi:hypothetical protein